MARIARTWLAVAGLAGRSRSRSPLAGAWDPLAWVTGPLRRPWPLDDVAGAATGLAAWPWSRASSSLTAWWQAT